MFFIRLLFHFSHTFTTSFHTGSVLTAQNNDDNIRWMENMQHLVCTVVARNQKSCLQGYGVLLRVRVGRLEEVNPGLYQDQPGHVVSAVLVRVMLELSLSPGVLACTTGSLCAQTGGHT